MDTKWMFTDIHSSLTGYGLSQEPSQMSIRCKMLYNMCTFSSPRMEESPPGQCTPSQLALESRTQCHGTHSACVIHTVILTRTSDTGKASLGNESLNRTNCREGS